ncbi:MAG: hypothetical protein GXP56_17685 [Deltaproteobacteria bacterium]|nr:hypothetical protein [Deltaproteobacteria bacterium]
MRKKLILIFCFLSLLINCNIANPETLTIQTKHTIFQFDYKSKDELKAKRISGQIPDIINSLEIFFGDKFHLKNKVVIKIIPNREVKNSSTPAAKNISFLPWQETIKLYPKAFSEGRDPAGLLAHELSHSIIRNNYGRFLGLYNPVPRWLDEGIANQFMMKDSMYTEKNLGDVLKKFPRLPGTANFLYENGAFSVFIKNEKVGPLKIYTISKGIVKLIINKIGQNKFLEFLDEVAGNKNKKELFDKYLGMSGMEIYWEYRRNLVSKEYNANDYKVADLHNDVLIKLLQDSKYLTKNDPNQQMSFKTIDEGNYNLLTFAIWLTAYYFNEEGEKYDWMQGKGWDALDRYRFLNRNIIKYCLNTIKKAFKDNEKFIWINEKKDLDTIENEKKVGVLLSVEGLHIVSTIDDVKWLYNNGVRLFGLVWNLDNNFAYSHGSKNGLTEKGKELAQNIVEWGALIDVSHASEQTIFDVIEVTGGKYPIIASHSGAKGIREMSRNLSDEAIKAIAKTGGIVGVPFYKVLLTRDKWRKPENKINVSVEEVLDNIDYVVNITSIDNVAMGSDYGLILPPAGLENAEFVQRIAIGLLNRGYSSEAVKKVMYKNVFRVLEDVID